MSKRKPQRARPTKGTPPAGKNAVGPVSKRAAEPAGLRVARNLYQCGRYDEALRKFDELVRQSPNDIRLLIDAARAHAGRHHHSRCHALLERALRLAPRRHDIQFLVGESYRMLGAASEAERCFRKACLLAEGFVPAQVELANLCERRHLLDEAQNLVSRVLRSQPQFPPALVLFGRIARRLGKVDSAESALRQCLAHNCPPATAAEAWGELILLYDEQAQYDQAWDAARQCKRLLLPSADAAWHAAQFVQQRFARFYDELRPSHLQRWLHNATNQTDQVTLLAGFPRSGTTLLEQVIASHPDVLACEEQDVLSADVFPKLGRDRPPDYPVELLLDELPSDRVTEMQTYYLQEMASRQRTERGARMLFDKNPALLPMVPVLWRLFPSARVLVAVRDPRDVIVSCFLRYLPVTPVSVHFLDMTWLADKYVHDLRCWLKLREISPATLWDEVRYEELVADFPAVTRRAIERLGLAWDPSILDYRQQLSSRRPVHSPTYDAVAKPVHRGAIGRWRNYSQQIGPVLEKLMPLVESFGYSC